MRNFVLLSLLAASAACAGCKNKPTHKDPPPNVGSAGSGSGGMRAAPDLILPAGPGTPPVKTTAPLSPDKFKELSKLTYTGFNAEVRTVGEKVMEVRQKTKDHPRLWATVTVQHCMDCVPMDLDKWKAKTEDLKMFLTPEMKTDPGTTFEVGKVDLHGQPVMWTYQLAQHAGSGEGGGTFAFTDALILYYNDGINSIRVVAEYKDDPVATKDKMAELAPKADLEALGISFIDVYSHAWN